ncbi:MAG: porin [Betaproteobacteria bacterium]
MARHGRPALALLQLTLAFAPCAGAQEGNAERLVSFSGFGTAGLAHSNTGGAEFARDILQPQGVVHGWSANVDSRLGLQVNMRATPEIEGVVQVVSSYTYANNYDPELTWAFVSYAPNPELKLRVGRLGWDVYMLSDSRYVGYSYLWVRPPVDYFGQLQIVHLDGADALFKRELGDGILSFKLYGGQAAQKIPSPPYGEYEVSGPVGGGYVDYQNGDWQLRVGYTAVRVANESPSLAPLSAALRATGIPAAEAIAADLSLAGKTLQMVSAGIVYDQGPWQAQLMFNRVYSDTLAFAPKESGYFLLGYRSGLWTPFVTVAGIQSHVSQRATGVPTPNPLDSAVAAALAASASTQRTVSVGVRYDFMPNLDLKLQLDQVRVFDNAALLWRNPQPGWNGRATIFSIALDFVF